MKRLLPLESWNHVFKPWSGANCVRYYDRGNVGDQLIRLGEAQAFEHFNIREEPGPVDVVFFGGGGNMGSYYASAAVSLHAARQRADNARVPLVILPQSWMATAPIRGDVEFAREHESLRFCPCANVAPDLALAYSPVEEAPPPVLNVGHFYRKDQESIRRAVNRRHPDPITLCYTPRQYLALASRYREIHTDRLHFAIAGLISRRRVVLYPCSYHKNEGVWRESLQALGCEWSTLTSS